VEPSGAAPAADGGGAAALTELPAADGGRAAGALGPGSAARATGPPAANTNPAAKAANRTLEQNIILCADIAETPTGRDPPTHESSDPAQSSANKTKQQHRHSNPTRQHEPNRRCVIQTPTRQHEPPLRHPKPQHANTNQTAAASSTPTQRHQLTDAPRRRPVGKPHSNAGSSGRGHRAQGLRA
jgi:hypothetical protein